MTRRPSVPLVLAALLGVVLAACQDGAERTDTEAGDVPPGADGAGDPPSAVPGDGSPESDGLHEASALASALDPDSVRERALVPGVRYTFLHISHGPWAIHAVEADLSRCDLFLDVVPPSQVGLEGLVRVSEIVRAVEGEVVAAVNGDFFTPEGSPIGAEVSEGVVRFRSTRPALAWSPDRDPDIAEARREDDSLRINGWSVGLEEPGEGVEIVGGFPQLLEGGRPTGDPSRSGAPTFSGGRQPRTAVVYDPTLRRVWLVVVDGRRPDHSAGMTLRELAGVLSALGAVDALNLDGGGSSVLVVDGEVVSRPSDDQGERPVVNALALRRDPERCPEGSAPRPSRTPDSGGSAPG